MKELYNIKFNCYIQPKTDYFSMPDLEELWKNTKVLTKSVRLFADDIGQAIKKLHHKYWCPIDIISIKKEIQNVKERL